MVYIIVYTISRGFITFTSEPCRVHHLLGLHVRWAKGDELLLLLLLLEKKRKENCIFALLAFSCIL